MFCNNCGAPIEAGSAFCNNCGARMTPDAPSAPVQPPVYPQPPVQPPVQPPQWGYPPQQPPVPPYQPPVPNMTYARAMGEQPAPQPWPYVAEQAPKEKKPINKRKLFTILGSSLVALLLVVGIVLYFTVFNTPKYKVYTAAQNSIEELETVLGKGKPVMTAAKNVLNMLEDGEMSIGLSIDGQSVSFDYSRDDEILRAAAEINGTEIIIAADDEKLAVSLPDYLNNAYSIPLKNFGKELCEWDAVASQIPSSYRDMLENISIDLFSDTWEEFKDTDAYEEFEEKLVFEEVGESIPNAKCDTVYRISVDVDDIMDLFLAYIEFVLEPIAGEELTATAMRELRSDVRESLRGRTLVILVGLNEDDCVTALRLSGETNGKEQGSFAVVLAGKDNPWELIELYESDEIDAALRIETTSSGFELYYDEYYYDYYYDYETGDYVDSDELTVDTDRILIADGKYLTFDPESRYPTTIAYSVNGDDCGFSFDADGIPVEISMSPDVNAKMISGNVVDIFSMDRYDIEELVEEIEDLEYLFD